MNEPGSFHIEVLRSELSTRKRKNPQYSLRAFSKSLDMDPGALSRILSGKQLLSPKACPRILKQISLGDEDRELFLASVLSQKTDEEYRHASGETEQIQCEETPVVRSRTEVSSTGMRKLPKRVYSALTNRYHTAILDLCSSKGFRSDISWIARQIPTTELHVRWIVSILLRAGLLIEKDGCWLPARSETKEGNKRPPSENSIFVTRSIQIDPTRISKANELIETFLTELESQLKPEDCGNSCQVAVHLRQRFT